MCRVCKYKNVDPKNGVCAMCGNKDANIVHLEAHRSKLKLKRGTSGLAGRDSSSWITELNTDDAEDHDDGHDHENDDHIIVSANSSSSSLPFSPSSPGLPRSPSTRSPDTKSKRKSVRTTNKKDNQSFSPKKKNLVVNGASGGINSIFRSQPKVDDINKKSVISENQPVPPPPKSEPSLLNHKPRHDSFDEVAPLAPNQRPPKSPSIGRKITSIKNGFTGFIPDSSPSPPPPPPPPLLRATVDEKVVAPSSLGQASVTSSTVAVRGGLVNNKMKKKKGKEGIHRKKKSSMSSPMTNKSEMDGDSISITDRSEAEFSISSHSTVKHSNTRNNLITTTQSEKNNKISKASRQNDGVSASIVSIPERSNSTPMIGQSFSSDDGEDLRASLPTKARKFSSVVQYPIQEDYEQILSPPLPPYYSSSSSPSHGMTANLPHLAPPRLQDPSDDEGNLSLAMSFGSGIASNAAVNGDDYTKHVSQTKNHNSAQNSLEEGTSPSDVDDTYEEPSNNPEGLVRKLRGKNSNRKCKHLVLWSVIGGVVVLSVVVVALVLAFAGNKDDSSDSSKFDLTTEAPSPTETAPPFNGGGSVVDEVDAAIAPVQIVSRAKGGPSEMIGSTVSVGGPIGSTWVGMHGNGFVRINRVDMELSQWTPVGSDIPVKGQAQLAISSDAGRIAIISSSLVSVRQITYDGPNDETGRWDVLDTFAISNADGGGSGGGNLLVSSVSLSASGKYLAHASVMSSPRGPVLSVTVEDVGNKDISNSEESNKTSISMTEILPFDASSDFVKVSISELGDVLAVCTRDNLMVMELQDSKLVESVVQPVLPSGSSISGCDLASNGLAVAVSLSDTTSTIVFSSKNSSWEQQLDSALIPFAGTTVSVDYSALVVAIADSTVDNGLVTVWKKSSDGYVLDGTILGGSDTKDFGVSLALSRRLFDKDLLVVGAPNGGSQNEGSVHVYEV
jgi:hypothetical protein